LAALNEGAEKKVPTLAICNVRESSLTRDAGSVIYTNAGPEIGVASTKAFTTQLAVLYMLAVQMGRARETLSSAYARELTEDLLRLPILVGGALEQAKKIEELAQDYLDLPFFFYMGRDAQYPIALEGALKLKEISYAHAEGYAAGELKHGPIALIDRSTAVMALAPTDLLSKHGPNRANQTSQMLYLKMMSNLQEVKSRGGKIVGFVSQGDTHFVKESQHAITIPAGTWGLNPILMSVPLQLFAYYMALHRGTDVDKPRNLAKSVTVE
jgi:glucosamine--fructose-6-phosphate aminotransferase (isomerizing)